MANDYKVARSMRKNPEGSLPPSDNKTLDPKYLLGHENHFDPNVYTPEQMIQKGALRGTPDVVKTV